MVQINQGEFRDTTAGQRLRCPRAHAADAHHHHMGPTDALSPCQAIQPCQPCETAVVQEGLRHDRVAYFNLARRSLAAAAASELGKATTNSCKVFLAAFRSFMSV